MFVDDSDVEVDEIDSDFQTESEDDDKSDAGEVELEQENVGLKYCDWDYFAARWQEEADFDAAAKAAK